MSSRKVVGVRSVALTAAAAAALLFAGQAAAQPLNGNWTFQGRLTDAGAPANGVYDIQLVVYSVPIGGAAIGISFHNNVAVTSGLFTIPDANAGFLGTFQGDRRWVEIQVRPGASVGAFTVLAPRQELTATPYAMYASRAGSVAGHTLDNAYDSGGAGNGRVITADAGRVAVIGPDGLGVETNITLGDSDTDGVFQLNVVGQRGLEFRAHAAAGGAVEGYQEDGVTRTYFLEPDVGGDGGFFQVLRGSGGGGFTVDGDTGAAGDPIVTIAGDTRTMTFNPGAASDNGSVNFPVDAIASAEILDEPGVSSSHTTGPTYAAGVMTITEESSITVPVSGYLYVVASAELVLGHVTGTNTTFTHGLNVNDSTLFPGDQDFRVNLPGVLPTGSYSQTIAVNGIFPVSAGTHTVYYLGREDSGNVNFTNDVQLSVAFFPTAYGAVDPRGGDGGDDENGRALERRTITLDDVLASRARAEQISTDRYAREIADLRAQLAELRKLIGAGNNAPNGR